MLLSKVETIAGIPGGFVTAVDLSAPDSSARVVARGLAFANGIAISPGGSTVAVAETAAIRVNFFRPEREPASGRLLKLQRFDSVHMPMFPDNLDFSANERTTSDAFDGALLTVSGHPRPLALLGFAKDPASPQKQSGTWSVSVEPAVKAPAEQGKMDLKAWRAQQDTPAPRPAAQRCLTQNSRWLIKTLYQAQKGWDGAVGAGVASGASALWDKEAQGTLLVPGLYSKGVLACRLVGL